MGWKMKIFENFIYWYVDKQGVLSTYFNTDTRGKWFLWLELYSDCPFISCFIFHLILTLVHIIPVMCIPYLRPFTLLYLQQQERILFRSALGFLWLLTSFPSAKVHRCRYCLGLARTAYVKDWINLQTKKLIAICRKPVF